MATCWSRHSRPRRAEPAAAAPSAPGSPTTSTVRRTARSSSTTTMPLAPGPSRTRSASPSDSCREAHSANKGRAVRRRSKAPPRSPCDPIPAPERDAVSSRKYRMTRPGARAVTVVALAAAILIGVEAAARAQEAGGRAAIPTVRSTIPGGVSVSGLVVGGMSLSEARAALYQLAWRPVTVAFHGRWWRFTPVALGADPQVDAAVEAAANAPEGAALELDVQI